MLLWLLRGCYAALILGVAGFAFLFFSSDVGPEHGGGAVAGLVAAATVFAIGGLVLFTDVKERNKQITTISAVYFGLLLGLLLGWLFALALDPIVRSMSGALPDPQQARLVLLARVTITVICCYVSISTLLQTKDEFRFIIPYVEFSKQVKGGRPLVLDTSVIIDGRIADVCDTRMIDTKLIVPRFVLQELQAIADSSDKMKRNRGRRGLDILKRLQTNPKVELQMHDGNVAEVRAGEKIRVDERLVLFAKAIGARVVTNDFNLNKIAQLQGVDVINLNEVANALKTVALPGEYLQVRVVKPGDQPGQGVGYLDDGTMVVIEQGRNQVGQEVSLVVTSVLQTPAGRMIFGRIEARPSGAYVPVGGPQSGTQQAIGGPQSGGQYPVGGPQSGGQPPARGTDPPKG
jgi:uncharacterized protein YacL